MKYEKWRETIDPFSLPYTCFELEEILGYPPAGNDVFHARGRYQGKTVSTYIKAARQQGADIARETSALCMLKGFPTPPVIDGGLKPPFCVTLSLQGERLSNILGDNADHASLRYMEEYGCMLARLHQVSDDFPPVAHRRFFDIPERAYFEEHGLMPAYAYLQENPPGERSICFCHGDFHYANILWKDGHISGVLDFELCGMGDRDFDIAWALIHRPGQRFMNTIEEIERFLCGYARLGTFDSRRIKYFMALIYVRFYALGAQDAQYATYVKEWLIQNTR